MADTAIRQLTSQDEFDSCVALQMETWRYTDTEVFPRRIFLIASRIGGQVLGAFLGQQMVGFTLAMPAYRDGRAYLHSQMLAVSSGARNAGIGMRLKLAQRQIALEQGFDLIEWTYDPLEIKNAYLNLVKLGAVSRRYVRDFYGHSSSPLQGGLPTDRLYAEWWIRDPRVEGALQRQPQPIEVRREVQVPAEIAVWKASDDERAKARQAQEEIAHALESAFGEGMVATGYRRLADGGGVFELAPWRPSAEERR